MQLSRKFHVFQEPLIIVDRQGEFHWTLNRHMVISLVYWLAWSDETETQIGASFLFMAPPNWKWHFLILLSHAIHYYIYDQNYITILLNFCFDCIGQKLKLNVFLLKWCDPFSFQLLQKKIVYNHQFLEATSINKIGEVWLFMK